MDVHTNFLFSPKNDVLFFLYFMILLPADPSLTPIKLFHAVSTVKHFWKGGLLEWLGVPLSVQDRIRASPSYYSEDERRTAGLQYYLQTVPGASWGRIASVLWFMEEHTSLETVTQYLLHKHGEYRCMDVHIV